VADIASVTEEQGKEYLRRLTLCAGWYFAAYGWGAHGRWAGPGGVTPDDVAAEAILKLLNGDRRYNPSDGPDIMVFLRNTVRSMVSHIADEPATTRRRPFPQVRSDDADDPKDVEPEGDEPEPFENAVKNEAVRRLKAAAAQEKDDLVERIVECVAEGIAKPAEIAVLLDVDIKVINNAQKRLRRKATQVLDKSRQERKP